MPVAASHATGRARDRAIGQALCNWYAQAKRDLPWRRTRDPYAIWVSEVMLQQTRVATVIPYWQRWLAKFPTVASLAAAPLDDVLATWAGLGYYSRARNLARGAQFVVDNCGGQVPSTAAELRSVPGIGAYTAGAIASIAYHQRTPLVDGNVARVLARLEVVHDDIKRPATLKHIWARATDLMAALPTTYPAASLNQALMELGALICTPTAPACARCPVSGHCGANQQGVTAELPIRGKPRPAAQLPVLREVVAWISDGRQVVAARRKPGGLFGGLWELPSDASESALLAAWGLASLSAPVAHHDQVLSHRRLALTVVAARLPLAAQAASAKPAANGLAYQPTLAPRYDRWQIVSLPALQSLGISKATAAIVAKFTDAPWPMPPSPPARQASIDGQHRAKRKPRAATKPVPPHAANRRATVRRAKQAARPKGTNP